MDLQVKSFTSGYCPGPNAGVEDETIYVCPCGKGEILYKKRITRISMSLAGKYDVMFAQKSMKLKKVN